MDDAVCAVKVDEARTGKDGKMKLKDEECTYGHKASQNTMRSGEAIRVIRRYKLDSKHAPRNGFRYDGSYIVIGCHEIRDENGFGSFYSTSSCESSRLLPDYNA
ncbi:hypothetical protein IW261DRAFT_1576696 [Armillaria novae-zelandiae]|uniref:YDG domain-containing protein n=1 Tax=Armillaria novae-zelandiae TaxID=153914 RepID=A0AA39N9Q4_9AGAR|nr:hypothetical protein IW261DRAFT_1576696 [Armillaria novae-zelandiae]